jgi:hypothetical protein
VAVIFRAPVVTSTPTKARFQGLVEVGLSFVLTALSLHSQIAKAPDLTQTPKRPVYVQVEQPPNALLYLKYIAPFVQELQDSPSPRLKYYQIDPPPNLQGSTLAAQVGFPFITPAIDIPSRRPIAQEPLQVQAAVLSQLRLNTISPTPDLTPTPRRPIYNQIDPIPDLLQTTLQPPPVNTFLLRAIDLPIPAKRLPAPEPLQVQAPVLTTLFFTANVPNPLITPTPKRPIYNQTEIPPSFVVLNLIAPAGQPFFPADLPNPVRKPNFNVSGTFYNGDRYPPTVLIQAPFFQNEQPNPNPQNKDLFAHTLTAVNLFGPLPFNWSDQQPPSRRPIYYQQAESGPNKLVQGIPRSPPGSYLNWENPSRRPIYNQDYNLPINFISLQAKPPAPFYQTDQPNPSRRPIYNQDYNLPINFISLQAKPPAPFYQTDQPNPSRRPISYPDQNAPIPFTLGIPVPAVPFIQSYFDNPILARLRIQPEIFPNLIVNTLTIPPPVLPFNNYDWPVFQRRRDITNQGIFDFGGTVFGSGAIWTTITDTVVPGWVTITTQTNAWSTITTATMTWTSVNTNQSTNNSGGVT